MKEPFRVGFCVSGQGRLFRSAAEELSPFGVEAACAVLDDRAAADLERFCDDRGVVHRRLPPRGSEDADSALREALAGADLDLVCLTFDRIVGAAVVEAFRERMINVHPGLLPAFKGLDAIERAATAGVRFIGATVHDVAAEVDAGAIIAQCVLALERGESADAAGARLYGLLRPMVLQVILWHAEGRVTRDTDGAVWVEGARYGELPIAPAVEHPALS